MPNAIAQRPTFEAIKAAFNTAASAPKLQESLRRLLADPFNLEGHPAPAKWQAPHVPPEFSKLRAAQQELEHTLQAGTPAHVAWCIRKLFALPARGVSAEAAAFQADNFLDAAEHYPDDLWTWGTKELLRAKTFRPAPAELVEIVEPKFAERQRMVERIKVMLEGKKALPAPASDGRQKFLPPAELLRELRKERDAKRAAGDLFSAAWCERSLALREKRTIEPWARDFFDQHGWAPSRSAEAQSTIDGTKSAYRALQDAGFAKDLRFREGDSAGLSVETGVHDPAEPPLPDAVAEAR